LQNAQKNWISSPDLLVTLRTKSRGGACPSPPSPSPPRTALQCCDKPPTVSAIEAVPNCAVVTRLVVRLGRTEISCDESLTWPHLRHIFPSWKHDRSGEGVGQTRAFFSAPPRRSERAQRLHPAPALRTIPAGNVGPPLAACRESFLRSAATSVR
jgi:hypothetical protein